MSDADRPQLSRQLAIVIARLAHDLKNPLAVIVSNLLYLQDEMSGGEVGDALRETSQSADMLGAQLDDAVDMLRLSSETFALRSREMALSEVKDALDVRLEGRLGTRRLVVVLPQRTLTLDATLLVRALCALVEHAVRQTQPGGEIRLEGRVVDETLEMAVIDGGLPFDPERTPTFMAPDFSEHVYHAGYRSDRGLGLGFAGNALRALGATVAVAPRDDGAEGVRFSIALPLSARSDA